MESSCDDEATTDCSGADKKILPMAQNQTIKTKKRERNSKRANRDRLIESTVRSIEFIAMVKDKANRQRRRNDAAVCVNVHKQRGVQMKSVLVFAILVPILLNSASNCSCYHHVQTSHLMPSAFSMQNNELAGAIGGFVDRHLRFAPATKPIEQVPFDAANHIEQFMSLDEIAHQQQATGETWSNYMLERQPIRQTVISGTPSNQADQIDWAPRLSAGRAPLIAFDENQPKIGQQPSPLSRAIEATRTFARQQQVPAARAAAATPSTTTSQSLSESQPPIIVGDQTAHQSRTNLVKDSIALPMISSLPSQMSSNLHESLLESRGLSLSQSLAAAKRKIAPTASEQVATHDEPFQLASSESQTGRGIVTLSAPYEQRPHIARQPPDGRQATSQSLVSLASGHQPITTENGPSDPADTDRIRWLTESANTYSMMTSEGEQAGPPNEQLNRTDELHTQVAASASGETAGEQESGQLNDDAHYDRDQSHHQPSQSSTLQWNVGGSPLSQLEHQIEIQRQPQQKLVEVSHDRDNRNQQQVVMINGELYLTPDHDTNQTETTTDSLSGQNNQGQTGVLQRFKNTTTADLMPIKDRNIKETQAGNRQNDDSGLRSSPESDSTNLQGDESLLAVQLPSQYESAISAPPEGHYDDYFKLMGGLSVNENQTSSSALTRHNNTAVAAVNSTRVQQQQPREDQSGQGLSFHLEQQRAPDHTGKYHVNQRLVNRNDSMPVDTRNVHLSTINRPVQMETGDVAGSHTSPPNASHYQTVINQSMLEPFNKSQPNQGNTDGEDGVQLIVANSNDQMHDPNTNEKVITYTSEGDGNKLARLIGQPARNTFFNKDLNELGSTQAPVTQQFPTSSHFKQQPSQSTPMTMLLNRVRSTRSPLVSMGTTAKPTGFLSTSTQRSSDDHDLHDDTTTFEMLEPTEDAQVVVEQEGQFGGYAQMDTTKPEHELKQAGLAMTQVKPKENRYTKAARAVTNQNGNNVNRKMSGQIDRHMHNKHHNHYRQQTRRPQVTEAKFRLKDLPLNAPTAMPSVGESTVKSIKELPVKAKRLRDHQVDKNELMSELLTALDRVKAAIYKLQPLTAKMNAVYRKSVTSNTRDQILDNNKGTYAKRYPPGDYDDSYDRMHPSELLERQRGSFWSNRSSSGNATGGGTVDKRPSARTDGDTTFLTAGLSNQTGNDDEHIHARDSRTSPVYLHAPRQMLKSILENGNGTTTGSDRRHHREHLLTTRLTSDDSRSSGSAVLSNGLGRRMGELPKKLRANLTTGGQIVYDDDDDDIDTDDYQPLSNQESATKTESVRHLSNNTSNEMPLGASSQFDRRQGELLAHYELVDSNKTSSSRANSTSTTLNDLIKQEATADEPDAERSPLFGYRITIYQSPGDQEPTGSSREKQILSYSMIDDGHGEPVELSYVDAKQDGGSSSNTSQLQQPLDDQLESMATSESSLVPVGRRDDEDQLGDQEEENLGESEPEAASGQQSSWTRQNPGQDDEDRSSPAIDKDDQQEERIGSESGKVAEIDGGKKHKKAMEETEVDKRKKKGKKAKGEKEGEKHFKHQAKGKKGQEEHKKKKEFKKIKHHKGVMSKESHKLHRDKHVKAHDRGAAKEKALKERTQIEFFEREQIVDDEFEKGKKSTMKAGWASGHDSKKSSTEIGKPDHQHESMSMGGSQQVGQLVEPAATTLKPTLARRDDGYMQPVTSASSLAPMMMDSAASEHHDHSKHHGKGKSHSVEHSSGKQSNKYEKKQMEAKGKKFKGWREKGYKIITETEFIDRGSLHDSAYKKRDKGAAHHQKFKKHESKSEGHQGSMHEHHKKSHKKEEKKSKSEEKKKEVIGKEEGKEGKKKKMKKKHADEHDGHHQEASAPRATATSLTATELAQYNAGGTTVMPSQIVSGHKYVRVGDSMKATGINQPEPRNNLQSHQLHTFSNTLRPNSLVVSSSPAVTLASFRPDQILNRESAGQVSRATPKGQSRVVTASRRSQPK